MMAIVARGLRKRFGDHQVLADLALEIPPGSIYGLLGKNGAGKTTLLKLSMGLLFPDAGEVRVLGYDLAAGAEGKRDVGYVAEQGLLPSWMTVGDVLRFEASARAQFDGARLERHLQREGIGAGRSVRALSKGQRKRLELELALAGDPRVLILDEPFEGLDPVSRAEGMEALVGHVGASEATVLVSSHVLSDLERICDRIGVLSGGRIAFESDLDRLKESVSLVYGPSQPGDGRLPAAAEVIASRSGAGGNAWLVRGLEPDQESHLRQQGFQLARPSLDELGIELIRCLGAREDQP